MSRRHTAKKRSISPDPTYKSTLVQMFVNRLMKDGKKTLAYRIMYNTLTTIYQKTNENPIKLLEKAVKNVCPEVEVKPRRMGGSVLQVPLSVEPARGTVLAIQWILSAARSRHGSTIVSQLTLEIIDAAQHRTGGAMKRKGEVQKMAEANKAFARFRF